ncbi:MAG: adenylosuccinate synthetase [Methylococcales bacterium]
MPVTVIVGGQFGSEGKGKVAHFFAREMGATVAIRVGGPNSGHTVIGPNGNPIIFKQLPTAALLPDVICVLPAGSYIQPSILLDEIRLAGLGNSRVLIDPNAVIITERELVAEQGSGLGAAIGSTDSGTGAAVVARIRRSREIRFAREEDALRPYVQSVTPFLRDRLDKNQRVLVEGTQGFGLSLLHTPHYPFATSRDTTAAGFVAEAGLSPLDVDDVVMVIRAFPIRVPGHSGPLPNETTWEEITQESNSSTPLSELTSVTRKQRRIARFDPAIVRLAIAHNRPTRIVLNHLDYLDSEGINLGQLPSKVIKFIKLVEAEIGKEVNYVGYNRTNISSFA